MAIAYVKHLGGAGSSTPGTVTMSVTGATAAGNAIFVVAAVAANAGTDFISCTDTKGNTYAQATRDRHTTAAVQHSLFVCLNPTAPLTTSDTITATHANGTNTPSIAAYEFSGLVTAGDSGEVKSESAGSVAPYDTGSAAIPAGSHLLFSLVTPVAALRVVTPSGSGTWIALPQTVDGTTGPRRVSPFYQIVSGGGTQQNVGSLDSAANWVASSTAFPAAAALGVPSGLTATPVSASQINLSWTAVSGATGYDIERDGTVIVSGQTGTTYSDSGLTASTLYTYRVRSVG